MSVSNGLGLITGTAPVGVETIMVNGAAWTLRWTTLSNWVATVPLQTGSNYFSILGLDVQRAGYPRHEQWRGSDLWPRRASPVGAVVINEIMFNPSCPGAEYVELFNTSATQAFDLSGWNFNGLAYTFPNGVSLRPRGFLVLAKDRAVFNADLWFRRHRLRRILRQPPGER